MKAAVVHRPNVPVSTKDLEIEAQQGGELLPDIVAADVSHSGYRLIRGHGTPKEVMVYGRFLAG